MQYLICSSATFQAPDSDPIAVFVCLPDIRRGQWPVELASQPTSIKVSDWMKIDVHEGESRDVLATEINQLVVVLLQ